MVFGNVLVVVSLGEALQSVAGGVQLLVCQLFD